MFINFFSILTFDVQNFKICWNLTESINIFYFSPQYNTFEVILQPYWTHVLFFIIIFKYRNWTTWNKFNDTIKNCGLQPLCSQRRAYFEKHARRTLMAIGYTNFVRVITRNNVDNNYTYYIQVLYINSHRFFYIGNWYLIILLTNGYYRRILLHLSESRYPMITRFAEIWTLGKFPKTICIS